MAAKLVARAAITIGADAARVWDALTDPVQIKQYLFGTDAVSDWKVGSPVVFRGEWQGTRYEDKGTILKALPGRLLSMTYWSSVSGLEDRPENYATVTYELAADGGGTRLTITQDNVADEKSREHSEKNWGSVLETMKKLLESA